MKGYIILICLCLAWAYTLAQTDCITIRGQVTSKDDKKAVGCARIHVLGQNIQTCANADGHYVLNLPAVGNRWQVVFSALGYQNDTLKASQLMRQPNLRLTPGAVTLNEVKIVSRTPYSVLLEAVERIPDNYWTDTTTGTFFFRTYRMINDSIYLFYENMIESLRVGYGRFNKKMFYLNPDRDGSRLLASDYNRILQSRMLVYDTTFLVKMIADSSLFVNLLNLSEKNILYDNLEAPNASYLFSRRILKRKKYPLSMQEMTTADGEEYYLIGGSISKKHFSFVITVNKADFAVTDITLDLDSAYYVYPSDSSYQKEHPYAYQRRIKNRDEWHYRKVGGKYTLVSRTWEADYIDSCHNKYSWKSVPTMQRFKSFFVVQMVDFRSGDATFFDKGRILEPRQINISKLHNNSPEYDEEFWQGYNTVPLEDGIRTLLEQRLR